MRKAASSFLVVGFCLAMAGCGDGNVEVKSTSTPNPVIIEQHNAANWNFGPWTLDLQLFALSVSSCPRPITVKFEIGRDEQLETARADFEMDGDVFADNGVRIAAGGDSERIEAEAQIGVFDFQF